MSLTGLVTLKGSLVKQDKVSGRGDKIGVSGEKGSLTKSEIRSEGSVAKHLN